VQALAEKMGVKVCLHEKPGCCIVDLPSPFSPDRKLPPLLFETALQVIDFQASAASRKIRDWVAC